VAVAEKSIIIIGTGIAGMATGCYAQMNGYSTRIFEMHDKPGGLCTAWQRKGYTIDGCLRWLAGSAPGHDLYRLWEELGMIQGKQIVSTEQFCCFEDTDGKVFTLYCDIDRLERHMKEIAPEDAVFINEFTKTIRHFTRFDMPVDKAPELYTPLDGIKMMFRVLPFLGDLRNMW